MIKLTIEIKELDNKVMVKIKENKRINISILESNQLDRFYEMIKDNTWKL
jgi:hypothetical protein